MKQLLVVGCLGSLLVACGNPGGVDDDFYEKYAKMGAPKILYQCASRIGYSVGIGINATYNKLVQDAERDCADDDFKILASKQ
jgi:hypothetical protein